MKKATTTKLAVTALTTASVLSLAAFSGAASSAPVYEDDDTRVDLYGFVRIGIENFDGDNQFRDFFSRLGVRASHEFSPGHSAFLHTEWRHNGAQRNNVDAFTENRLSYIGVEGDFGRVTAGSQYSLYYLNVSSRNDIFATARSQRLGDLRDYAIDRSVAYVSPNFNGIRAGVQAAHASETQSFSGDEEVNLQAFVGGDVGDFNWGLAVDQRNEDMPRDGGTTQSADPGETLFGAGLTWQATPEWSVTGLAEIEGDITHLNLNTAYDYGMGSVYGLVQNVDLDGDDYTNFGLGVRYNVASPMWLFAEFHGGNTGSPYEDNFIAVGGQYAF